MTQKTKKLKVRTAIRSGGIDFNHSRRLIRL
jgi:hypothetical protein